MMANGFVAAIKPSVTYSIYAPSLLCAAPSPSSSLTSASPVFN